MKNRFLVIFLLTVIPITVTVYAQTSVTPTINPATDSSEVVTPSSAVPTPDPVIVEGPTTPDSNPTTESSEVVTPSSAVPTPDPVIVEGPTTPDSNPATDTTNSVSPSMIVGLQPASSDITKTIFSRDGTTFVPQPAPVITTSDITKDTFSRDGNSFVPQPEPVITSSEITKSSFTQIGNIIRNPMIVVGGILDAINTKAVVLAGAHLTASWLIPVIVAGIGIGFVIARKF